MTEIEFGGGSSIEQRAAFCAPEDGSHMPGYTGHCHQYRFANGHTYGELTHRLAQAFDCQYRKNVRTEPSETSMLTNELPESTGDNKFTKDMKPGYTGYIPRLKFKYGGRYTNLCDVSLDQHINNHKKVLEYESCMRHTVKSYPKFQVLNHDPNVKDHLSTYRDTHPLPPILAEHRRGFLEPPICTWVGFVPRVGTTDTGLGLPYREASRRGFARLRCETDNHYDIVQLPVNVHCSPSSVPHADNPVCKRIYLNDGMIPKWTGWVPGQKQEFGKTYGDGTRSLEVCSHDKECYGDYMRTKGAVPSLVIT